MQEGVDAYRAAGQLIALPHLLAGLAEGHALAGEVAAGLACLTEARCAAESTGEVRYLAELHRLEGECHVAANDRDAAEAAFRRAIEVAQQRGGRWLELRASVSLARLPQRRLQQRATRRALVALVGSFTEGFDTADIQAAQALLTTATTDVRRRRL